MTIENTEVQDNTTDDAPNPASNDTAAELARIASDAAKTEIDGLRTDLFARLDALTAKLEEQTAPVPETDTRRPNNSAVHTELADLSPAARIAAGYKS